MNTRHLRAGLVAAALFLAAVPGLAAGLCSPTLLKTERVSRVLTVDGTGTDCSYYTLDGALAYVTAQTRSATRPWFVLVKPGKDNSTYNYTGATFAVPSWTTVVWVSANNRPTVRLTGVTGSLVTLGTGSALENIVLSAGGTAATSGAVKVVATTGTSASLTNVSIAVGSTFGDAQNVDLVSNDAGTLALTNVDFSKTGTATKVRFLVNGAAGTAVTASGGTWTAGTSQAKGAENLNAAGTMALSAVTIATAATADLAGTTGPITYGNMALPTSSGTVTGTAAPTATLAAAATALAANGANCSAGSAPLGVSAAGAAESCTAYQAAQVAMPVNANDACVAGTFSVDASFAAFCVATNTWVRVAVATWP